MAAVDLDRQSIERRDFPIGRRGYDPAAVDAHLRALATEVEELRRALEHRAGESLGSTAGTQVQGILEAAEATAADIEQKASEDARRTRAEADGDAERTRADAVQRAQVHVAAVAQATAVLSERVESMDGEASALVESLRAGTSRLANDLTSVETNMAELYDAASGQTLGTDRVSAVSTEQTATKIEEPARPRDVPPPPVAAAASPSLSSSSPPPAPVPAPLVPASPPEQSATENDDLDGARLIALNMALNGESRVATDRYLAEHYDLADRHKLLDEVYAAIEG
jgi:DivIVA domain-containing protein